MTDPVTESVLADATIKDKIMNEMSLKQKKK